MFSRGFVLAVVAAVASVSEGQDLSILPVPVPTPGTTSAPAPGGACCLPKLCTDDAVLKGTSTRLTYLCPDVTTVKVTETVFVTPPLVALTSLSGEDDKTTTVTATEKSTAHVTKTVHSASLGSSVVDSSTVAVISSLLSWKHSHTVSIVRPSSIPVDIDSTTTTHVKSKSTVTIVSTVSANSSHPGHHTLSPSNTPTGVPTFASSSWKFPRPTTNPRGEKPSTTYHSSVGWVLTNPVRESTATASSDVLTKWANSTTVVVPTVSVPSSVPAVTYTPTLTMNTTLPIGRPTEGTSVFTDGTAISSNVHKETSYASWLRSDAVPTSVTTDGTFISSEVSSKTPLTSIPSAWWLPIPSASVDTTVTDLEVFPTMSNDVDPTPAVVPSVESSVTDLEIFPTVSNDVDPTPAVTPSDLEMFPSITNDDSSVSVLVPTHYVAARDHDQDHKDGHNTTATVTQTTTGAPTHTSAKGGAGNVRAGLVVPVLGLVLAAMLI